MSHTSIRTVLAAGLLALITTGINADEKLFAYSYQADSILPKGTVEFEQWATLRSGKDTGQFARWDIRHEIEYGFTDTFTGAIYLNSSNIYSNGVSNTDNNNGTQFDGVSLELKQMILSPHKNPIGILVYAEPKYSGNELELEGKLVFESILKDNWHFVTNLVIEKEWEYTATSTEHSSAFEITGGVSMQLDPTLAIGIEGKSTTTYDGFFSSAKSTAIFLGPNIHFGTDKFQITAAILKQLTNVYTSAESLEARVITGVFF